MERFYVSKLPHRDGYHEVHRAGCRYFPADRKDLGLHPNYKSAVFESQKFFPNTNGCFFCLSEGHVRDQAFQTTNNEERTTNNDQRTTKQIQLKNF